MTLATHRLSSGPQVDLLTYLSLTASFAFLVTSHVALCFGLLRRRPRWRAPLALVVPPLAPFWGLEQGLRWRAGLWLLALTGYIVSFLLAQR